MLATIKSLSVIIERVSGILIAVVTALIISSAIVRHLTPYSLPDGYDFSRLLLGVAVFWGFAVACYRNDHIRVDLINSMLGARLSKVVDVFSILVVILFASVFCYAFYGTVERAYHSGLRTVDLGMPIWPAYALAWVGVLMATFLCIIKAINILYSARQDEDCAQNSLLGDGHG